MTLNTECSEIRELSADETAFVSGGTVAAIFGAIKAAKWISDNTGGSIDMGKLCEWARNQK
jgi:hypothetical protein